MIALNITTMERSWQGFDPVLLERAVTVSASVAVHEADAGAAVGLIANGSFPDADRPTAPPQSRRPTGERRVGRHDQRCGAGDQLVVQMQGGIGVDPTQDPAVGPAVQLVGRHPSFGDGVCADEEAVRRTTERCHAA